MLLSGPGPRQPTREETGKSCLGLRLHGRRDQRNAPVRFRFWPEVFSNEAVRKVTRPRGIQGERPECHEAVWIVAQSV